MIPEGETSGDGVASCWMAEEEGNGSVSVPENAGAQADRMQRRRLMKRAETRASVMTLMRY